MSASVSSDFLVGGLDALARLAARWPALHFDTSPERSYNWHALVEVDISRYKRVIGDALRSQSDARQATEVVIAVRALNRTIELGRPESVRIV